MDRFDILVEGLTKTYRVAERRRGAVGTIAGVFHRRWRTVEALKGISFGLAEGEMVGLIGPNGAGKSTTLKILCGILEPSAGRCVVGGLVPWRERVRHVAARADAVSRGLRATSIAAFASTVIDCIAIWALFARFRAIDGWRFGEVALFYGVISVAFALADALTRGFDIFGEQFVKTGDFDRRFVRPRWAAVVACGSRALSGEGSRHDVAWVGLARRYVLIHPARLLFERARHRHCGANACGGLWALAG